MKKIACISFLFLIITLCSLGQEPRISVHDPVMARENGVYYIFATGRGISVFSSTDMKSWKRESPVFGTPPEWAVEAVPAFKGHIWAPDISYYKGEYYLYYSVSAFGKNTSCMGVASNKTLNPESPDFKWVDHGKVIQSYPNVTNWNAIDPNLIFDDEGTPWFSFGSFWDGLQLVQLNPDLKTISKGKEPVTFASQKLDPNAENPPSIDNNPVDAGANAIEAPFIFRKGDFFYLFASIDYCCKGVNSTYKMIIGRSKDVQGPYLDKDSRSMRNGGGSLLMQGDEHWHGVGHNAVVSFDGVDYLVFHAYDAADNGRPKLRIFELNWDENGWPFPGKEVY
jgi:arabinan endo-1,5-alpha-L-arabinosidase